ncbi:MAG TPA: hypothetical protein VN873_11810 [Candidatus Angelobacter sp.]|nr:hypothetical protein [Candidatus Angelobacter sp.]
MVKAGIRFAWLLAVVLLPISFLSAKELGDYQVGDKAEEDIVATSKLNFVDPEGTDALRQKEAQRVPVILRYDTNAASEVEGRFRKAFEETRENFLGSVNKDFGHEKLADDEIDSFKFHTLAVLFEKQNQLFPMSTSQAALWASGDDDKAYEDTLAAKLKQAMSAVIHPETIPANFRFGATVRVIPVGSLNEAISEQEAGLTSWDFSRTNFASLSNARKQLVALFPGDEHVVGKYLSTLLQPNTAIDEDVTSRLRAKRTDGIWAVANYAPGEIVAHRGQVIDRKIKTALDLLKEKAVVGQLQDLQVKQQAAVGELQQLVAAGKEKGARAQERVMWLVAGLAVIVLVLAAAIWQLARGKPAATLLPAPTNAGALEWQQRALVAEERTEKLQSAARAGLAAQLSKWLSSVLTRRLISQRRMLLDTQTNAAAEMAELEARLQRVQAPLQVRLAAYEHRIAELEKELTARGEENRELLKSKIEMMRRQLEAEREKNRETNRVEFN